MLQRHTLPRIVLDMKIRPAAVGDRDAILRVHALAIRHGARGHYSPQQIAAWEAFPAPEGHAAELRSGHVFVAEDGGTIVGYGRFDTETGELEATYVLPELHGRGIGAALLAESEDRARRAGFDSIHVSASLNAVAFYARAGFVPQVERRYKLPGGLHLECLFMIKRLEASSAGGRGEGRPGQLDPDQGCAGGHGAHSNPSGAEARAHLRGGLEPGQRGFGVVARLRRLPGIARSTIGR